MRPFIYLILILKVYAAHAQSSDCLPCGSGTAHTVTTTPLTLCSPRYPKNYPKGARCYWQLSTEVSCWIKITIKFLRISYSKGCKKSNLSFVDRARKTFSSKSSPCTKRHNRITRLCGRERKVRSITLQTHLAEAWFISHKKQRTWKGFKITVEKIPSGCYKKLTAPKGTIMSPIVPSTSKYEKTLYCKWVIVVNSPADIVEITCTRFKLALGKRAKNNFEDCLRIRGGEGIDKYYTGTRGPVGISTCGSNVMVEFYSNIKGVDTGFKCNYMVIPGIGLGDICKEDKDCQKADPNAECVDGICQCKDNFVAVNGVCQPVQGNGDPCIDAKQCQAEDINTACISDTCQCNPPEDFIIVNGICYPKACIGEECEHTEQCEEYDINSECDPTLKKCVCKYGYVEGPSGLRSTTQCHPEVAIGGQCDVSEQCQALDKNTACLNDTCQCNPPEDFVVVNATCCPVSTIGGPCKKDEQCEAWDENSECNQTCVCKFGYTEGTPAFRSQTHCFKSIKDGGNCISSSQCEEHDENSKCENNQCLCIDNYISINNTCHKTGDLNESCDFDEQCQALDHLTACINNTCSCQAGAEVFSGRIRATDICVIPKDEGDDCTKPAECQVTDPLLDCINKTCQCVNGYVFTNGSCHDVAEIGDACTVDGQCSDPNAECDDVKKTCQCVSGYVEGTGGFRAAQPCLPIAEHGENCTKDIQCSTHDQNSKCCDDKLCCCIDEYIYTDGEICETVGALNEPCNFDEQCEALDNLTVCINNTCVCQAGAEVFPGRIRTTDICVIPKDEGESCKTPPECQVTDPLLDCINMTCQCIDGYVFTNGSCHKIADIGENCTVDGQCTASNTECDGTTCECKSGYVQFHGIFRHSSECLVIAEHGQDCSHGIQCSSHDQNTTCCDDDLCCCVDGYIHIDGGMCEKIGALNDACNFDEQCQALDNLTACINNTCSCQAGAEVFSGRIRATDICVIPKNEGEECKTPPECKVRDEFMDCINNTCQCIETYIFTEGKCYKIAFLNTSCEVDGQCAATDNGSECDDTTHTCECTNEYVEHHSFMRAIPVCLPTADVGEPCEIDKQCSVVNNLTLCEDGACTCIAGYVEGPELFRDTMVTCYGIKEIGEPCKVDEQCEAANNMTECKAGNCSCMSDYVQDNDACLPPVNVGDPCITTSQCEAVDNASSCVGGSCVCNAGYLQADAVLRTEQKCYIHAALGDKCIIDKQCTAVTNHSECDAGSCACINDYIRFNDSCIPVVALGQPCFQTIQCEGNTIGSFCDDNENDTCQCIPGDYVQFEDTCLQVGEIGEPCTQDIQCEEANILTECIDNKCDCLMDVYVAFEGVCHPIRELNEPCNVTVQCTAAVDYSGCVNHTCVCSDGYVEDNEFCYPIRKVGEDCSIQKQCTENDENSHCLAEYCFCVFGFVPYNFGCEPTRQVGETCKGTVQCSFSDSKSECDNGVCVCTGDSLPYEGSCHDTEIVGSNCVFNLQCSTHDSNSFCDESVSPSVCTCNTTAGYVPFSGMCVEKVDLGDPCVIDAQCEVPNSECSGGICICIKNYYECSAVPNVCFKGIKLAVTVMAVPSDTIPASGDIQMCITGFNMGSIKFTGSSSEVLRFGYTPTTAKVEERITGGPYTAIGGTAPWTNNDPYVITYSAVSNTFTLTEAGSPSALLSGSPTLYTLPTSWTTIEFTNTDFSPAVFMIINP